MKLIRTLILSLLALFAATGAYAVIPTNYYRAADGKKDEALKTALHDIICNFQSISSYSALPSYFQTTDVYPESRRWWDMYSDIPFYAPSFSGLNREHCVPKSWWGRIENKAYTDLNHLYPSEMRANSAKSNYPLGEVSHSDFDNGVVKVGAPVGGQGGGSRSVFEPNDEYKGDFARTYFYMATCYQDLKWTYTYMFGNSNYLTLNTWSVNLLLKWHRQDPVSEKERDRNEAVYGFQRNRNPFIDYPQLVEHIWGSKKGESFDLASAGDQPVDPTPAGDPALLEPIKDTTLDFGQVALGNTSTSRLLIRAENLPATGKVTFQIYKDDYKMFVPATTEIKATQAASAIGYWLEVAYKPTELGTHSARLLITGDFGNVGVGLKGECLPVPDLQQCTATAPTDITATGYTANWTSPDDDIVDYYVVTRTRYVNGAAETTELLAQDNFLEIEDFGDSDRESYSVQSVYLNHRSPMSNVIYVEHSGITGVEVEKPLVVQSFDGIIRFICSEPQTNAMIYDVSGRLMRAVPAVEQNFDIEIGSGVYFIVTDQHRTPLRVYVR